MSKRQLAILLSLIVIGSLLIAACGSANNDTQATPEPTIQSIPTMSHNETTVEWETYIFAADGLTNLLGKSTTDKHDVFGFLIGEQAYTMKTRLFEDTSGDTQLWLAVHSVDKNGLITDRHDCYLWNGHSTALVISTNNNLGEFETSQQISVFCPVEDDKTLYIWYTPIVEDKFYQELLTGTPAQNGTVIGTLLLPESTATVTQTPLPDYTFTQTVTGTPPTATATALGDHCPKVNNNEYELRFKFDEAQQVVNISATICYLTIPNGQRVYGTYYGKVSGRDTWTYAFTVGKDGVLPGILTHKAYVVDSDKCWHISQRNDYQFYMCPRLATATATNTNTATITPSPTSTPTFANTATPRP